MVLKLSNQETEGGLSPLSLQYCLWHNTLFRKYAVRSSRARLRRHQSTKAPHAMTKPASTAQRDFERGEDDVEATSAHTKEEERKEHTAEEEEEEAALSLLKLFPVAKRRSHGLS